MPRGGFPRPAGRPRAAWRAHDRRRRGGPSVLVACWSVKGGVGTTVIAAALALLMAGKSPAGAVIADLAGDVPAALGRPGPESPGLAGWLAAGDDVPADALRRLEAPGVDGLTMLPRGRGPLDPRRAGLLASLLDLSPRPAVVDCGRLADVETSPPGAGTGAGTGATGEAGTADAVARAVIAHASRSTMVVRPCYLALRRAARAPVRPTGIVVVREPGRVLAPDDVERIAGAPVAAVVELDPAVARAVDAGVLARRLPRSLTKALDRAT